MKLSPMSTLRYPGVFTLARFEEMACCRSWARLRDRRNPCIAGVEKRLSDIIAFSCRDRATHLRFILPPGDGG